LQIGQRGKTPFRLVEPESKIDEPGIDDKRRKKICNPVEMDAQLLVFKTNEESCNDRRSRHREIVQNNQPLP